MHGSGLPEQEDERTKLKQQAAEYAVKFVQSGMVVGLGTGSTAIFATKRIADLLREGTLSHIRGFATSKHVWEESQRLHIPMIDDAMPEDLDLTIDGADEVDSNLDLIKGGGGIRKIRLAIGSQGKRGGARVIYYWVARRDVILLLFAYSKRATEDLTPKQVSLLARVVKEEFGNEKGDV